MLSGKPRNEGNVRMKKNELIKCEICVQSDVVVVEALEGSVR